MTTNSKTKKEKLPKTQRPDNGQGSKGNFGSDGDWGKEPKKTTQQSSPVPPKKA